MPQLNGICGTPSGAPLLPCGVWGDCRDDPGVIGTSLRRIGVRGETRDRSGVYGRSERASGVLGFGRRFGVQGISEGQGSDVDPTVYAGVYANGRDFGLFSEGVFGVFSRSTAGAGGAAGLFEGNVRISGELLVDGDFVVLPGNTKSAAVPHPDGTMRLLYSLESPESWFEDFGRAEVVQGSARVELDSDFSAVVDTSDYHVFLSPEGESEGLHVGARTSHYFDVHERRGGTAPVPFSYRVVARRKDVGVARLPRMDIPSSPQVRQVPPPDIEEPPVWERVEEE